MHTRIKKFFTKNPNIFPQSTVVPGLAVTPREMDEKSQLGIPISSSLNPDLFNDGDFTNVMDVPIECVRGIDAVDLFNASSDARSKLKSVK